MNLCNQCGHETTNKKYCSKSCAAKSNNLLRTTESRSKQRNSTIATCLAKRLTKKTVQIEGPYSKIYLCTCKYTGRKWYSRTVKTIHPETIATKELYSYQCRFQFSFSQFPDWFPDAGRLIQQYGFWQTKDKNKTNLQGLSRDHLYSVSDGFKNQIDPKLLAHPANCSLVTHTSNQNKHAKSTISLEELKIRIAKFESIYGPHVR